MPKFNIMSDGSNGSTVIAYQVPANKILTVFGYQFFPEIGDLENIFNLSADNSEVIEGETVPAAPQIEFIASCNYLSAKDVRFPIPLVLTASQLLCISPSYGTGGIRVVFYCELRDAVSYPPVTQEDVPNAPQYQIAVDETIGGEA